MILIVGVEAEYELTKQISIEVQLAVCLILGILLILNIWKMKEEDMP